MGDFSIPVAGGHFRNHNLIALVPLGVFLFGFQVVGEAGKHRDRVHVTPVVDRVLGFAVLGIPAIDS